MFVARTSLGQCSLVASRTAPSCAGAMHLDRSQTTFVTSPLPTFIYVFILPMYLFH